GAPRHLRVVVGRCAEIVAVVRAVVADVEAARAGARFTQAVDVARRPRCLPAATAAPDRGQGRAAVRDRTVVDLHAGRARLGLPGLVDQLVAGHPGGLPREGELAPGLLRQAPVGAEVPAVGADRADVAQDVVEADDLAARVALVETARERIAGGDAAIEDGLRVQRLDRAVDRVAVEGHAQVEPVGPRPRLGERRAPHTSQHQAATGFRLQLLVARGHHRDLRVGLLVVGGHAFGHAFGRGRGRTV